ncbi:hypothetical protein BOTBODRAFT_33709 [Botryobasidium botryosum FD-172 SS1]|uniref:DNA (cytosine-5-)-methyltransferase n=1 Tax=Botryobasidium botryosum (strain FD-172 SS1) TaxID=930990 RepID=A0A067MCZ2_BOTB1|nr:hypothetical protein BOTBODRAFT_33709 [Botryobasidium botryosum FD-172 SS1]
MDTGSKTSTGSADCEPPQKPAHIKRKARVQPYFFNMGKSYGRPGVWTPQAGVRELIQNWYDGIIQMSNKAPIDLIFKEKEQKSGLVFDATCDERPLGRISWTLSDSSNKLTLTNYATKLDKDVVLMGASSKRNTTSELQRHLIGGHGEGMKIGINALLRKGSQVRYETNKEIWIFKYEQNPVIRKETMVVRFRATNNVRAREDTTVHVERISPEVVAFDNFLFLRPPRDRLESSDSEVAAQRGCILLDAQHHSRLYCKGILVRSDTSARGLRYGVNILTQIQLGRDREIASDPRELHRAIYAIWQSVLLHSDRARDLYLDLFSTHPDCEDIADAPGMVGIDEARLLFAHLRLRESEDSFLYSEDDAVETSHHIKEILKRSPLKISKKLYSIFRRHMLIRTFEEQRQKLFRDSAPSLLLQSPLRFIRHTTWLLAALVHVFPAPQRPRYAFKEVPPGIDVDSVRSTVTDQGLELFLNHRNLDVEHVHLACVHCPVYSSVARLASVEDQTFDLICDCGATELAAIIAEDALGALPAREQRGILREGINLAALMPRSLSYDTMPSGIVKIEWCTLAGESSHDFIVEIWRDLECPDDKLFGSIDPDAGVVIDTQTDDNIAASAEDGPTLILKTTLHSIDVDGLEVGVEYVARVRADRACAFYSQPLVVTPTLPKPETPAPDLDAELPRESPSGPSVDINPNSSVASNFGDIPPRAIPEPVSVDAGLESDDEDYDPPHFDPISPPASNQHAMHSRHRSPTSHRSCSPPETIDLADDFWLDPPYLEEDDTNDDEDYEFSEDIDEEEPVRLESIPIPREKFLPVDQLTILGQIVCVGDIIEIEHTPVSRRRQLALAAKAPTRFIIHVHELRVPTDPADTTNILKFTRYVFGVSSPFQRQLGKNADEVLLVFGDEESMGTSEDAETMVHHEITDILGKRHIIHTDLCRDDGPLVLNGETICRWAIMQQGKRDARIIRPATSLIAQQYRAQNPEYEASEDLTAVDLFSGCGGSSVGFEMAGFEIILGVERDPSAAAAWNLNHRDAQQQPEDVQRFLYDYRQGLIIAPGVGSPTALLMSTSCQGFSSANSGGKDDEQHCRQVDMVGQALQILTPQYLFYENVTGILRPQCIKYLYDMLEDILDLGYQVMFSELRASGFGVPQHRKRIIVVAAAPGLSLPNWPEPTHGESIRLKPFVTVRDAISDLNWCNLRQPSQRLDNTCKRPRSTGLCDFARSLDPDHGFYKRIVYNHVTGSKPKKAEDWQSAQWDKPSGTITCSLNKRWPCLHPGRGDFMTVRELARLQSFPDRCRFWGSIGQQYKQVGNAVPPLLARAIAESISKVARPLHSRSREGLGEDEGDPRNGQHEGGRRSDKNEGDEGDGDTFVADEIQQGRITASTAARRTRGREEDEVGDSEYHSQVKRIRR